MKKSSIAFAVGYSVACWVSVAHAQTGMPANTSANTFSGTCNSGSFCFQVVDNFNATTGAIVATTTGDGIGVFGQTQTGFGVYGSSSQGGYGVYGFSSDIGVYGDSNTGNGVEGVSAGVNGSGAGVSGVNTSTTGIAYGVFGESESSAGVAVQGEATSTTGITYGGKFTTQSPEGAAVYGIANGTTGVNYGGLFQSLSTNINAAGFKAVGVGTGAVFTGGSLGAQFQCTNSDCVGGTFTGSADGVTATCTNSGCLAGVFNGATNTTGCIEYNGTPEFGCSSDARLKKDIRPMSGALDTLLSLHGVTYDWMDPKTHGKHATERQTGFVAQDVERVVPAWVDEDKDGYKTLAIQPAHVTALEVEAIRELMARVKELEAERSPRVTMSMDGLGLGAAGLAIASAVVVLSRRRREATHQ